MVFTEQGLCARSDIVSGLQVYDFLIVAPVLDKKVVRTVAGFDANTYQAIGILRRRPLHRPGEKLEVAFLDHKELS